MSGNRRVEGRENRREGRGVEEEEDRRGGRRDTGRG